SRPVGPVQSVTYRSNQAAWLGVLRKMSFVPLRWTAKSWAWCMGRQARLASGPGARGGAVASEVGSGGGWRSAAAGGGGRAVGGGQGAARRYPNPVYDSTPTSSSRWFRYSTSMIQKRPAPSFVVLGSLTERRICRVCSTSPGRTGSWKTIVLSVITASG